MNDMEGSLFGRSGSIIIYPPTSNSIRIAMKLLVIALKNKI